MTDNPLEGLGGGFDMSSLLQQAQQMQEQLQNAQAQLAEQTVEGSVAGGAVTVTVNGLGDLVGVRIRPGTVDGDSEADLGDLSDMIIAAYREARSQAETIASGALGPLAGGGLPGLG